MVLQLRDTLPDLLMIEAESNSAAVEEKAGNNLAIVAVVVREGRLTFVEVKIVDSCEIVVAKVASNLPLVFVVARVANSLAESAANVKDANTWPVVEEMVASN